MDAVTRFIKENWIKTIHAPNDITHGCVTMKKPYTSPCEVDMFPDFFYWDTYFTNLGLMQDKMVDQARNNIENMAYLIEKLTYMPNASHLLSRSQPPLFTRALYDYFKKTKDLDFVKACLPMVDREHKFWMISRITPIGLNRYDTDSNKFEIYEYRWMIERGGEKIPDDFEKIIEMTKNRMAVAESGWDMTSRFDTDEERYKCRSFCPVDLNSILYDAEVKASEMYELIGDKDKSKEYRTYFTNRKSLMNKYLYNRELGVYLDYDFESNKHSKIVSSASFAPYTFNVSSDYRGCRKVLELNEMEFGLSACPYRGDAKYQQWDYPAMWPTNVYFAFEGLMSCGMRNDAQRIKEKYLNTVLKSFEDTGFLWEKYDSTKGKPLYHEEYDTPRMMGWTAGVYRYLVEKK